MEVQGHLKGSPYLHLLAQVFLLISLRMEDIHIVPSLEQEENSHIEEQNVLNSWNLVTCYYITKNKLLVGMNGEK